MALGFREERLSASRRRRRGVVRWILGLAVIVGLGYFAYHTGSSLAEGEVNELRDEIARLEETISTLEQELAAQQIAVQAERMKTKEWRQRYQENTLSGQMKTMLELIRAKLEAGVDEQRLAFFINAARNPRTCDNKPKTKRFLVQTPLFKGANDSVGFHKNTITVTARGKSAVNAAGKREGWYDPAKPITVWFAHIGGETVETSGKLPLHHSVVVGGDEFRFSVVAGAQGFVKVTADRCDYP